MSYYIKGGPVSFTGKSTVTSIPSVYLLSGSLIFEDTDGPYLKRTLGSNGTSQQKGTMSVWVKRSKLNELQIIQMCTNTGGADVNSMSITFNASNQISCTSQASYLVTTATYTNTYDWNHIVLAMDTTQATASDRVKLYVNGVQITAFGTENYPVLNSAGFNLSGHIQQFGDSWLNNRNLSGYYADAYFIDGEQLTPDAFAETVSGTWSPKAYTGSYGSQGYHLPLSADTNDTSGNGNNFTATNIAASDYVLDVPTTKYCTLNYSQSAATLTQGGLRTDAPGSAGEYAALGNVGLTSGKWYFEAKMHTLSAASGQAGGVGMARTTINTSGAAAAYPHFVGAYFGTGSWYTVRFGTTTAVPSLVGTVVGDVMNFAVDIDAGKIWIGKNGTWANSGDPAAGTNPTDTWTPVAETLYPMLSPFNNVSSLWEHSVDFGQRGFDYTIPTGFNTISSNNLP